MNKTEKQYKEIVDKCQEVFTKKTKDYGTAWRIMRPSSITDQLFIKAKRIRSLEENKERKVDEGVESEYIGLVNYSVMALINLFNEKFDDNNGLFKIYNQNLETTFELMKTKNHDYGEAWRDMRITSLTDLILMKILRIKQIEDNDGQTIISEGLDANYHDIINYSIFALINLSFLTITS